MTTAQARLYAATRRGLAPVDTHVLLTWTDALALSRLVETLCPDEEGCELCGERLCDTCRIGEAHPCPNRFVVCVTCRGECCAECRNEMREDA